MRQDYTLEDILDLLNLDKVSEQAFNSQIVDIIELLIRRVENFIVEPGADKNRLDMLHKEIYLLVVNFVIDQNHLLELQTAQLLEDVNKAIRTCREEENS